MSDSDVVSTHYTTGGLLGKIDAGIRALGKDSESVSIEDLGPVDEFHVGGRPATMQLCDELRLETQSNVLDIGSGIGGTARFVSTTFGCTVTGIDITPEYVEVADVLTSRLGLAKKVTFRTASALDLPFGDETFDRAIQLHVGMNIADKAALFAEIYRVLEPGGRFGVYDVMALASAEVTFPVPWASNADMSHVESLDVYRSALTEAGFVIAAETDQSGLAKGFFAQARKNAAASDGPSPLGVHLLMGSDAPTKLRNLVAGVEGGLVAPIQLICQKP